MSREFEVAIAAAEAAAEVLRNSFGQEHNIEYKGGEELVTEVDKRAEQAIKEVLGDAFPGYGILTEESGLLGSEGESHWIVDPLDGTTNYVHGIPLFCTSIALMREGEVILGVVHGPMANEIYAARRSGGTTLNGYPIGVSDTDEPARALLGTSFPDASEELPSGLHLFERFMKMTRGMRRLGSGALDLCYVAAGRLDGCYEQGFSPWDVAAGILIVEEAGGKITDYRGGRVNLEKGEGLVASNGFIHPKLVSVTIGNRG